MFSSRHILIPVAALALLAWANVQAMTCCWSLGAAHLSEAVADVDDIDHSCCPAKASTTSPSPEPTQDIPACGMSAQGFSALCCDAGPAAIVSVAKWVSSDFSAMSAWHSAEYQTELGLAPNLYSPVDLAASDGPRWLFLRHLLI
jgi:hypothetical protein